MFEALVAMQLLFLTGLGVVMAFAATRHSLAAATHRFVEKDSEHLRNCRPILASSSKVIRSCISDEGVIVVVSAEKIDE